MAYKHCNMHLLRILLLFIRIGCLKALFYADRIKPGKFEYPALNGWMLVDEAVEKCETDFACGGFTFKGPKMLDRFVPTGLDMCETLPDLKAIQHLFLPLPGKSPA